MNVIGVSASLSLLFISCFNNPSYTINTESTGTKIVTGKFDRTLLSNDPALKEWFEGNYKSYDYNPSDERQLDSLCSGLKFVVVMGTWCSDSKREVPRFFKVLDSAHASQDTILLYGVDRSKQNALGTAATYDIEKVPTIIVFDKGKELGRIVESPHESTEYDLLEILRKK